MGNAKAPAKKSAKASPAKAKASAPGPATATLDAFLRPKPLMPARPAPPDRQLTASARLVSGIVEILSSDDAEAHDGPAMALPSKGPPSRPAAAQPAGLPANEEPEKDPEEHLNGIDLTWDDDEPWDDFGPDAGQGRGEVEDGSAPLPPPPDKDFIPDDFFDREVDEEAYLKAGIGSDDLFDEAQEPCFGQSILIRDPAGPNSFIIESSPSKPCQPEPPLAGPSQGAENVCPVCSASLMEMKPRVAESHVNRCLDRDSLPPSQKRRKSDKGTAISVSSSPEDAGSTEANPQPEPKEEKKPVPVLQKSLMNFFGFSNGSGEAPPPEPQPAQETSRWTAWGSRGGPNKPPPFHKKVPGTGFYVDAFGYGDIANATGYFLSHYHADHFGGLTKKGKTAPIYCSKVTANLCRKQLKVPDEKLSELPWEGEVSVPDGSNLVRVQTMDANHCPGSILLLFHVPLPGPTTRTYLHCGDFRATPAMLQHPFLRLPHPLDMLFLDTTYAKPEHRFPPQERVVETVCEVVRRGVYEGNGVKEVVRDETGRIRREAIGTGKGKGVMGGLLGWFTGVQHVPKPKKERAAEPEPAQSSRGTLTSYFVPTTKPSQASARKPTTLVVCGSYQIGKERLYKALAETLGTKVYAESGKRGLLECQEDPTLSNLLTTDPAQAAIHVVGMGTVQCDPLLDLLANVKSKGGKYDRVLGIRPTGWTWTAKGRGMPTSAQGGSPNRNFSIQHLKPYQPHPLVTILDVPYSEHSSFTELEAFVTGLAAGPGLRKCIPTVGSGKEGWREAAGWCDRWTARGVEVRMRRELEVENGGQGSVEK